MRAAPLSTAGAGTLSRLCVCVRQVACGVCGRWHMQNEVDICLSGWGFGQSTWLLRGIVAVSFAAAAGAGAAAAAAWLPA